MTNTGGDGAENASEKIELASDRSKPPSPLSLFLERWQDTHYLRIRNITLMAAGIFALLGLTGEVTRTIIGDIRFPTPEAKRAALIVAIGAMAWMIFELWQSAKQAIARWEATWTSAETATEAFMVRQYSDIRDRIRTSMVNRQSQILREEIELLTRQLDSRDSGSELASASAGAIDNTSTDDRTTVAARSDAETITDDSPNFQAIAQRIDSLESSIRAVPSMSFRELAASVAGRKILTPDGRRLEFKDAVTASLGEIQHEIFVGPDVGFEKLNTLREYSEFAELRDKYRRSKFWRRYSAPILIMLLGIFSIVVFQRYRDPGPKESIVEKVVKSESHLWRQTISALLGARYASPDAVVWNGATPQSFTMALPIFRKWNDEMIDEAPNGPGAKIAPFLTDFLRDIAECSRLTANEPLELEVVGYADSKLTDFEEISALRENLKLAERRATNFKEFLESQYEKAGANVIEHQPVVASDERIVISVRSWLNNADSAPVREVFRAHDRMRRHSGFQDYELESLGRFSRRVDLVVKDAGRCANDAFESNLSTFDSGGL
jgi:hypothetical protein